MSHLLTATGEEFGAANNLGQNLNDTVEYDNTAHYFSTISFYLDVPTGGEVTFEAQVDGTWEAVNVRSIDNDRYLQVTDSSGKFIGSIAGAKKFRARTSSAGTADGTISGRAVRGNALLEGIEFSAPPHRFGYPSVHKDASYTTAQTATDIWTPATDKKAIVTDITLVVGGTTDGVVTIFDETDAAGNRLFRGTIDVSNNRQFVWEKAFVTPYVSNAINNDIKITTSANMTVDVIMHGYEVNGD